MVIPSATANSKEQLGGAAKMDADSAHCFRVTRQWYAPCPSADNCYVEDPPTHFRFQRVKGRKPVRKGWLD